MARFEREECLRKDFVVFGNFYELDAGKCSSFPCRSVLEIVNRSDCPKNLAQLMKKKPNAVFVMMNPGSSSPSSAPISQNIVSLRTMLVMRQTLVEAKPDPTLYQLMRLMLRRNWRHVRVLNLSDLKNSRSTGFFETLERFKDVAKENFADRHSVFSEDRSDELQNRLGSDTPVICAWGQNPKLDELVNLCEANFFRGGTLLGLERLGKGLPKFAHPCPRLFEERQRWLIQMNRHLTNKGVS